MVEVIDDDAGETTAFPESGTVSNEVCGAGARGKCLFMSLAGVADSLELDIRKSAAGNEIRV